MTPLSDPASPFSIAVVCDTQNYVSYRNQSEEGFPFNAREILWDMMHHIVRNAQANGGDIAFVTGLGDSWQHPSRWGPDAAHLARGLAGVANPIVEAHIPAAPEKVLDVEIPAVRKAYEIIAGVLPFSLVPGNHDHDHIWTDPNFPPDATALVHDGAAWGIGSVHVGQLENWTRVFGAQSDLFRDKPWYVSSHSEGRNSAQLFEAGGYQFLHLGLEMSPEDDVIDWARSTIRRFDGLPTIVSIHEFLNARGERKPIDCFDLTRIDPERNGPQQVWEKLIAPNDQIFMTLNGHFHGVMHRVDHNDHGHKVYQFLVNYQGRRQSQKAVAPDARLVDGVGDGWLRLMRFDLASEAPQLRLATYSTYYKAYAQDIAAYPLWYANEHPELTPEERLALDHRLFPLDDFKARFGPPKRLAHD